MYRTGTAGSSASRRHDHPALRHHSSSGEGRSSPLPPRVGRSGPNVTARFKSCTHGQRFEPSSRIVWLRPDGAFRKFQLTLQSSSHPRLLRVAVKSAFVLGSSILLATINRQSQFRSPDFRSRSSFNLIQLHAKVSAPMNWNWQRGSLRPSTSQPVSRTEESCGHHRPGDERQL